MTHRKRKRISPSPFLGAAILAFALVLIAWAAAQAAAPREVSGGIEFSYYSPGAGAVYLAGSFNGWNAQQLPLSDDGKGNWTIVHALAAGKHEYKFVVDGGWFADPDNPNTQPDPYGGANSVVEIGSDGKIVQATAAAAAESRPMSNTPLNARVYIAGRYLTRNQFEKNKEDDPRYRLQRPSQQVDLNFYTTVSDLVDSYVRIRLDNGENIIQNNIAGFLDEASVEVHPAQFTVIGYWDQEIFSLGDPLNLGGDVDLPGTILDDHLDSGKGTSGALVKAAPAGIKLQAFLADVHNFDFYNDPDIYDDTGQDLYGLRLSRNFGPYELGVPAYLERELIWMDFGGLVGQEQTGIPVLDVYLEGETGERSNWFEFERHDYRMGLDLSRRLWGDRARLQLEWLYGDRRQAFLTGDNAGIDNANGAIDVPILERSLQIWHGSLDVDLGEATHLNIENTWTGMGGADAEERALDLEFRHQDEANKKIFFTVAESPAQTTSLYSEATLTWGQENRHHLFWLQRLEEDEDFAVVGRTDPEVGMGDSRETVRWVFSALTRLGQPEGKWGLWEMEKALSWLDIDVDDVGASAKSMEMIMRYEKSVSRNLSLLTDLRYIKYDVSIDALGEDPAQDIDETYWAPYGGIRYRPNNKVEIVLAYGVDPLNFGIDYRGRHIGRWWHRQQYLFDNPEKSELDAEQHLEDARVFGLRAHFTF